MIFRRAVAKLRAQDWLAISIELAIVVLGVFIGTWVANGNQERLSRQETRHLLLQLKPELNRILAASRNTQAYYATSRRFADVAFRGWAGDPTVSDRDFVVAAYQASQIHGFNSNPSWSLVFGGDQLRNIDDLGIRQPLVRLMTFNVDILNETTVATPYRADVRKIIPDNIQREIRGVCGDRFSEQTADFSLPETCNAKLDPSQATSVAMDLRAHPELASELRSHLGLVSGFLNQVIQYEALANTLQLRLTALKD